MSVPPLQELVNAFEFEEVAKQKLGAAAYDEVAGGDRKAFDRITFRPRMMVDSTKLDLTTELLGQKMFAPIVVGPVGDQKRFHPEGEAAMMRGAAAAKAAVVVSCRASVPVSQIMEQAKTAVWYQVYPEPEMLGKAQDAVKCGCKAICLTLGATKGSADWALVDQMRQSTGVPLLIKGIMSREEVRQALQRGAQGIVVSNYTARTDNPSAPTIEMLPGIVEAVGGKAPVLIDGSFRRGSDVLKALALGAKAVLLGRPVMWGLAAYGADGVQKVLELLQTELARDMAMCGRPTLKSIDPAIVKVHRR
jgi:isopentenyl diphosphate isomerase/L-lactate dehydrogenase-like FMN-dependent dehydrogenase